MYPQPVDVLPVTPNMLLDGVLLTLCFRPGAWDALPCQRRDKRKSAIDCNVAHGDVAARLA